jgi:hypothetical protein
MDYNRITEYIDIHAPRAEVFQLIVDIDRRMKLSPLWGTANIEMLPADYPQVGSTYRVRHKPPEPTQDANTPARAVEMLPPAPPADPPAQPLVVDSVVTAYEPPYKLSYCLDVDQQTNVTWNLTEIAAGTRLTYSEEYLVDPQQAVEFNAAVRGIVKSWLRNLKNYAELREGRIKRFVRWLLDNYYLKMGPDQRKIVSVLLFMQITGIISFILAAIAMGIGSLLF